MTIDNMQLTSIEKYLCTKKVQVDQQILSDIRRIKSDAIKNKDEKTANICWCFETAYEIQKLYLSVFTQLKDGEYEKAWGNLETIEILAYNFNKHASNYIHKSASSDFYIDWILKKVRAFQKVYPYKLFFSRECIIKKSHCSICGKPTLLRSGCNHVPGNLYMGELCNRVVDDMELVALALVENPEDKYALLHIQGQEFDYKALDLLMENLDGPYDIWELQIKNVLRPEYRGINQNSMCPCGSNQKYKDCCYGTSNELMEHYHFIFTKYCTKGNSQGK